MGRALAPTIGKIHGLLALGGLASEGASKLVKKMTGGFLIPQSKINQLIAYKHLLTNNQRRDILNALQTGSGVRIQPTRTPLGNGLGTD